MKKYLMTWYGMTDFRASLGLEQSMGPVLSALHAEDYTDIVILAFTHPEKTKSKMDEFEQKIEGMKSSDSASKEFIEQFSNSVDAHKYFAQWLDKSLSEAAKKVRIHFHSVSLSRLNDTEGIYEAANYALNAVENEESEKLVTLYLSPGTPVMAFVWAFAALRHPALKKRLIASSQPGKPPEEIILPNEWLEWHGRQVKKTNADIDQYDVIFHLFGEQRMPSLLGVIQFVSRKHIFVNSPEFPADVMRQFIGDAEYGEIAVDPYDPENVRATILDIIERMPANAKIGFNLTGGTKLMYAGALAACRKVNATPFYFNSRNNQLIYLNNFKSVDTKIIPSVETFIKLRGNHLFISKPGYWDDIWDINNPTRSSLTKHMWMQRFTVAGLYKSLASFNDEPGRNFQFSYKHISVSLREENKAEIIIKNKMGKESAFRFKNWPDFARYLTGGWFEEYTFMKLKPLVDSGLIKDIRIGLEVSLNQNDSDKGVLSTETQLSSLFADTYQEFDISFTDGRCLYVIECKAGNVNSEHVMKIQNIVRYFGGVEGKAILATCFSPKHKVVRKKIEDSKNLQLVSSDNMFKELEEIIQLGALHK